MGLQRAGHDLATEQQQCMPATVLRFGNTVMIPYNPMTPDVVTAFGNPQFYGETGQQAVTTAISL